MFSVVNVEWFGYAGAVLGVIMFLPQLVVLIKHKKARGVAISTWTLMIAANFSWILYGFRANYPPIAWGNLAIIWGSIAVTAAAVTLQPQWRATWYKQGAGVWLPIICVGAAAVGGVWSGLVAVILSLISRVPQTITSVQSARNHTQTDVSVLSWVVTVVAALLWGTYGILVHDPAGITVNAILLILAGVVIVCETRNRTIRKPHPNTYCL